MQKFHSFFLVSLFTLILFFKVGTAKGQFAPAAGKPGSTAIRYDSICFVSWAIKSKIHPGFMDISMPDSGYAKVGDSVSATGKALQNGVVSLGDGGYATLQFPFPIRNETGWDFAVFENTFLDSFLELGFVEVSSNGTEYVRFPSQSLTDTSVQTGGFGYTRPENVNNLAGKYIAGYGTPFDLDELKDSSKIDISNIQFVRVRDVVGCINPLYAQRDAMGHKINDPWPTRFASGGFDLDAVGVIHENKSAYVKSQIRNNFFFSNPVSCNHWNVFTEHALEIHIYSASGRKISIIHCDSGAHELQPNLLPGMYFIQSGEQFYPLIVE